MRVLSIAIVKNKQSKSKPQLQNIINLLAFGHKEIISKQLNQKQNWKPISSRSTSVAEHLKPPKKTPQKKGILHILRGRAREKIEMENVQN